jgi:hypothetical protein
LQKKLNQSKKEKQQLPVKEAQKAKGGRRASQEHKPSKPNAQRLRQNVFVETYHNLKDHNILSFDAGGDPPANAGRISSGSQHNLFVFFR